MGQLGENGTYHSVALLHNSACLHRIGKSDNRCTNIFTKYYCGYYAHLFAPDGKSLRWCFWLVSLICFCCAAGLYNFQLRAKLERCNNPHYLQVQSKTAISTKNSSATFLTKPNIVVQSKFPTLWQFSSVIIIFQLIGKPPVWKCTTCLRTNPRWRPELFSQSLYHQPGYAHHPSSSAWLYLWFVSDLCVCAHVSCTCVYVCGRAEYCWRAVAFLAGVGFNWNTQCVVWVPVSQWKL